MIIRLDISPPLLKQAGDRFYAEGNTIEQRRGFTQVALRTFDRVLSHARIELTDFVGGSVLDFLLLEIRMAASLTITDVQYLETGDRQVFYSNGSDEVLTLSQCNERASNADGGLKDDAFAYWKARSSDFSSSTPVVGKTFQKDMSLELGQLQVGEV